MLVVLGDMLGLEMLSEGRVSGDGSTTGLDAYVRFKLGDDSYLEGDTLVG
jgi:hypothetical protein